MKAIIYLKRANDCLADAAKHCNINPRATEIEISTARAWIKDAREEILRDYHEKENEISNQSDNDLPW